MKRTLIVLSLLVLLLLAGCKPNASDDIVLRGPGLTVDDFLASYDAAHFIFDGLASSQSGIFGNLAFDGTEMELSTADEDTYKKNLTSLFTKDNSRLNVTRIVNAEGSRTATKDDSGTHFTVEVKDANVVFEYTKQTYSEGEGWTDAEGATSTTGYLRFSGKQYREKVADRGGDPETIIYTYSDIKLSVTNLTGDGYCDVSSSDVKSYYDISWKVKLSSTDSYPVYWAKCVNTDMSDDDIKKIHDHIYRLG